MHKPYKSAAPIIIIIITVMIHKQIATKNSMSNYLQRENKRRIDLSVTFKYLPITHSPNTDPSSDPIRSSKIRSGWNSGSYRKVETEKSDENTKKKIHFTTHTQIYKYKTRKNYVNCNENLFFGFFLIGDFFYFHVKFR